jgi:hypothetical protein
MHTYIHTFIYFSTKGEVAQSSCHNEFYYSYEGNKQPNQRTLLYSKIHKVCPLLSAKNKNDPPSPTVLAWKLNLKQKIKTQNLSYKWLKNNHLTITYLTNYEKRFPQLQLARLLHFIFLQAVGYLHHLGITVPGQASYWIEKGRAALLVYNATCIKADYQTFN